MRNLLRVLILWSKNRTIKNIEGKNKDVSFTYGKGLLQMIVRLFSLGNQVDEEDVFWVVSGLIRSFPRPFSVSESIMIEDCKSVVRYEIVAFKALIENRLPEVNQKLQ